MNNLIVGISLLLVSATCTAQGDIWNNLFREKLRDASQGNSEAQYDVGSMYLNGRGVKADRTTAAGWFSKAAAQNNPQAISRLKLMHENETRFSKTLAAAELGDRDSQYDLGNMYTKGIGVDIDYQRAIATYEQSAGQGSDKAAYKLGLIYYEGTGIPQNMKTAFKWFMHAAENDHTAAQYYLGKMYAAGQGTGKDNTAALEWFNRAVNGGFDQARGAMIDITENMAMQAVATPAAEPVQSAPEAPAAAAGKPGAMAGTPPRVGGSRRSAKQNSKGWGIEDLMLAAWYRDSEPVTYLPSTINNCRIDDDRLVCFSDDQTRQTGANLIKYKTKAIIENFSSTGTFSVTYRNLVIDASRIEDPDSAGDTGVDGNPDSGYTVKTGWGTPHTLECQFKNRSTLSCLKNKSYNIELTTPKNLATGR